MVPADVELSPQSIEAVKSTAFVDASAVKVATTPLKFFVD